MENWKEHLEKVNKELEPFDIILDVEYSHADNCYSIYRTDHNYIVCVEGNLSDEELCEEISVAGINLIEGTIKTPVDVRRFFYWLFDCKRLSFHPDDSFFDYVENHTEKRTFTDGEAEALDDVMELCFDVCEESNVDIYEIALAEKRRWMDEYTLKSRQIHTLSLTTISSSDPAIDGCTEVLPFRERNNAVKRMKEYINNEREEAEGNGYKVHFAHDTDWYVEMTWDGGNEGIKASITSCEFQD